MANVALVGGKSRKGELHFFTLSLEQAHVAEGIAQVVCLRTTTAAAAGKMLRNQHSQGLAGMRLSAGHNGEIAGLFAGACGTRNIKDECSKITLGIRMAQLAGKECIPEFDVRLVGGVVIFLRASNGVPNLIGGEDNPRMNETSVSFERPVVTRSAWAMAMTDLNTPSVIVVCGIKVHDCF